MKRPVDSASRLNIGRWKIFLRDLVQELIDYFSFEDIYRFCLVGQIVGGLPLFFKSCQGDMDECLFFVDIFVAAYNAAFSRTVGSGEGDIADFIAGKYVIQSFLVIAKVNRVIWR